MMLAQLSLIAFSPPAHACGGFFCDSAAPVLQAAERIVFGIDREAGEVEMHVQITYEGPAKDFAWIVPVPGIPDLGVSTSALFTQLATQTQPTFVLNQVDEGDCHESSRGLFGGSEQALAGDASDDVNDTDDGGVNVLAQEAVGPYLTVTLEADSTDALLEWLNEHGYDVPGTLGPALDPYVVRDATFVALKLQKGNDVGDLAPLMLTFAADKATVPVQLTSVAATPDMRMEAYLLSTGRGVPTSYLHVQINEAAVDWWTAGSNYSDVITQAADEAGGHAFATDYYGTTELFSGLIFDPSRFDESALRDVHNSQEWLSLLPQMLVTSSTELFEVLEDQVATVGEGNGQLAWQCPDCIDIDSSFDAELATDDLMARAADPMEHAQELVDKFDKLARLTSSLDAVEMTVDPVFAVNDDMASTEVATAHAADLVYECGGGKLRSKASRRLELADGRVIDLPSEQWMEENNRTDFEFISGLGETKAILIEQMGETGQPVVLFDDTEHQQDLTDEHNAFVRSLLGCGGCNGGVPGAGLGLLVSAASLLVARRRRHTA